MKQISANFGALKDTVYTFSAKEMIAESGKKSTILNKFFNLIQENAVLKVQYLVFKNLENGFCSKERLAERFINQNLKLVENFKWEQILKANKDAKISLVSDYEAEVVSGKDELYEAIHTLIKSVTKRDFSDIDNAHNAFDYVMEHLMKQKQESNENLANLEESEHPKLLSWQFITKHAVNKFNERYAHLNENERNLVKILLSSDENKLNFFSELKENNLSEIEKLLSQDLDEITKTAVNKFKTKILSLQESVISPSNMDEAIINLAELKEGLAELGNN